MLDSALVFGNQTIGLVALYPELQIVKWKLPIPNGVLSELSVEKGQIYFGGGDGYLYSVDGESGRVNWKYALRNPLVSRPEVNAGRVFITTTADIVYALDAGSGEWIWHYKRGTSAVATVKGASSPIVDGNDVIVGMSDGYLVSLSKDDGQLKWERKIHDGYKFMDVDAKPVLSEGLILIPSYDGALYALRRNNGQVVWRFDAGGSKRVVVDGDRIYVPSNNGSIFAIQKSNADVLWKFEMDGGTPTQLVVSKRYVVFGSDFQYLYALKKRTGEPVYRFNTGWGSGFSGSPAFDDEKNRLYILSQGGNLYSFHVFDSN